MTPRLPGWMAAMLLTAGSVAADCPGSTLDRQIGELARSQGTQIAQTVGRIDGTGRQLLALRSYLRVSDSIAARWSWTQDQIESYRQSAEYAQLLAEIERIRAKFEADNPGYQLYANTEVRSLDVQIERWNGNPTVGRVAGDLQQQACVKLASIASRQGRLREFLKDWIPGEPPPLAAPGLSRHGRARAIDFQIHRGSEVIAGTDTRDVQGAWIAKGWARKLATAIESTSTKFVGPLKMPDEPWHFEYEPEPERKGVGGRGRG